MRPSPRRWRRLAVGAVVLVAILPACQLLSGGSGFEVGQPAGGTGGTHAGGGGTGGTHAGGGGAGGGTSPGAHLWSERFGGADDDEGALVATDAAGHVYLAGAFRGTMKIGESTLTANGDGSADAFVAKLDPDGTPLWASAFGGTDDDALSGLAVDGNGNVYAVGHFKGSLDFGTDSYLSHGAEDAMVVSYDADGAPRWSKAFGGAYEDSANDVAISSTDRVAVIGTFRDTVAFPDQTLIALDVANTHAPDVFLLFMNQAGGTPISRQLGDKAFDQGASLAFDPSDNLVIAGSFRGTWTLNGNCAPIKATFSLTTYDVFLVKLDTNGACLWASQFGDSASDTANRVATGPTGEVLSSGQFGGYIDFGGPGALQATGGDGGLDAFVAGFSAAGTFRFTRQLGGLGEDTSADVAFDAAGGALMSGFCQTQVDFGEGPQACGGGGDGFLLKLDGQGAPVWGKVLGGAGIDTSWGVGIGPQDQVMVGGMFTGTINVGGSDLVSAGGYDIFVAAYGP